MSIKLVNVVLLVAATYHRLCVRIRSAIIAHSVNVCWPNNFHDYGRERKWFGL